MIQLAAWEEIIDASGVAARIEALLPAGARTRQLSVRTLLAGKSAIRFRGPHHSPGRSMRL